jgi:hypothetical protein
MSRTTIPCALTDLEDFSSAPESCEACSEMQRRSRTATLFLAFFAGTILGCGSASGSPEFRIRSVRMAGDELRVILEGVFSNEAPSATLVPFSDGPRYEIAPPLDRSEWGLVMPDRIQLLEKPTRIAFFGTNDFMSPKARHRVPDEAVTVFIWDLAKGKMSVHDAPTGQLFRSDRGEYVPKQATKIE